MSAFTAASEVLLRHCDEFRARRVLFAGDLQDDLPACMETASSRVHTQQYHHWQRLSHAMGKRACFSLEADATMSRDADTLIYYWPKNKSEAQFQLMNVLSLMPSGSDIFIVGENRAGVRSTGQMLEALSPLYKVDSARRCGLYHGRLESRPAFTLDAWWKEYHYNGLTIKTLPGVFSRDGLDVGSQLLLSTLMHHTEGNVLDMGCGAGVLAATLASHSPKVRLTLCDVSASAIAASRATLAANDIKGNVLTSNVFSDISGRFDMIISNPPFHEGLQTNLNAAQALIRDAIRHLTICGELRIVANAFLPYTNVLDDVFGHHDVIAQTGRFKVYRAVAKHTAKHNRQ